MIRVVLLGGTSEASAMAVALAEAGVEAVFSYAGRTSQPKAQPLPVRIGGFGGVEGLRAFLREGRFSHVIDATHPFAARISGNAIAACGALGVPLIALERPVWRAGEGDLWTHVPDIEAAVAALPERPARVFLAIGKQSLAGFGAKPRHHYLLRLVDAPEALPLPDCTVILSRGPFDAEADAALMRHHRITHVVAKNAGGMGARAKLEAARGLGLPVILIDRPRIAERAVAGDVAEVMLWLHRTANLGV